jgi:hypothetical protein
MARFVAVRNKTLRWARRHRASGSGRSWKFTTSRLDWFSSVVPGAPEAGASKPSMCMGILIKAVQAFITMYRP